MINGQTEFPLKRHLGYQKASLLVADHPQSLQPTAVVFGDVRAFLEGGFVALTLYIVHRKVIRDSAEVGICGNYSAT